MKLWVVSRTDFIGYDDYDSMVVAAETEEEARYTHPSDNRFWSEGLQGWVSRWCPNTLDNYHSWAEAKTLTVEYLGTTDRKTSGIILASFNAG